ncbi:MAG: hydantoinase B/oxoprolinase family protein [Gammaproteobacteria bacterium]
MDAIELGLFASRIQAVCDEMGAVLRRTAFSPNIRDRLDYSCAVFDVHGDLVAQAAHIPVHLGSMAYAMAGVVAELDWTEGDMVVFNDPFLGGTHLPDVTLVAPVYHAGERVGFVANRAHHADIGASSPGSMPISRRLEDEGQIIAPTRLVTAAGMESDVLDGIVGATRGGRAARGDFMAQVSANRAGMLRLRELVDGLSPAGFAHALDALNDYGERLARATVGALPDGAYSFEDYMDDDGQGQTDIPIRARVVIEGETVNVDFNGTAEQVAGNINCPLSVAAAAVFYVFRCLMPGQTPACAGVFRNLTLEAPRGCLLNAQRPAAVAAGNVETSTRIVDVICGALAMAVPELIPAASHGSMNNIAMGSVTSEGGWDYYETVGGGMGAGARGGGLSGVQTHMTNTLNTPVEVLEQHFPLRVETYALRAGSGGTGKRAGGDGLVRTYRFLEPATVTLLTERRRVGPWGRDGGCNGAPGVNRLNGGVVPGKCQLDVVAGDRVSLETPGGGGWG